MNYANRVRRLEDKIVATQEPLHIVVHFIDPIRGVVSALDKMTDTWFERGDDESENKFAARVKRTANAAPL